jgi:hypothetical protein
MAEECGKNENFKIFGGYMQKVPELIFHSGVMQQCELTFYCGRS